MKFKINKKLILLFLIFVFSSSLSSCSYLKFRQLKERGLLAVKEDRLTVGINALNEALSIKEDPEIEQILDQAYAERGEYFFSIGKIPEALEDLHKCNKENVKAKNTLCNIDSQKSVFLYKPENQFKYESTNLTFSWEKKDLADYYEIQVEDEDWRTVFIKKVQVNTLVSNKDLRYQKIYYWRVRAHYPNGQWSVWSEKNWFSIHYSKKYLDDFKNSCKNVPYQELARYPKKYLDEKVHFTGRVMHVIEVDEKSSGKYLLDLNLIVSLTHVSSYFSSYYGDNIYVLYNRMVDQRRFLEGDIVQIWGFSKDLYTYQSVGAGSITIPLLHTVAIEIVE